ncbi:hypothetical protein [Pseudidiomarina indica]|uniref:hypothetical protein n=1 Tax=Pseudidiomarina indica TaxID=1159017 RepID=UPI000B822ADD|nr:hypothetical protein [Pseudidiomarina indica]
MSDYIETTKEEAATALGYLGTGLATLGTGGTVFAGWLILGSAAVLDPSLQNIIGATTGPLGKAMRPVDDFFFPGATPLQQTIENVGHLNTAVTVACDIPFKCL